MSITRPGSGLTGALTWTSTKTAAYSPTAAQAVPLDTSLGSFPVTLPALGAGSVVRLKWKAGGLAPTVVAGSGRTLDPSWPGFGATGDSADFADDGTTWNVV